MKKYSQDQHLQKKGNKQDWTEKEGAEIHLQKYFNQPTETSWFLRIVPN